MPTRRGPPQATSGVILHLGSFGEAHRLVEVLSSEHGRQTCVARHARTSRRRFAGILTAFADVTLQVQGGTGQSMVTIVEAELVQGRDAIRKTLNRINRATTLVACVRHLFPEGQAAPEAYTLLRLALDYVAQGAVVRAAGAYPRLAQAAGITPDLHVCQRCHNRAKDVGLVGAQLICPRCNRTRRYAPEAVYTALQGGRIHDASVANAVEDVVVAWTSEHSGKAIVRLPQGPDDAT